MAPPCEAFPSRQLPLRVQVNVEGKARKTESGAQIDLARDCELFTLLQYECVVPRPDVPESPVTCWPVRRWLRR